MVGHVEVRAERQQHEGQAEGHPQAPPLAGSPEDADGRQQDDGEAGEGQPLPARPPDVDAVESRPPDPLDRRRRDPRQEVGGVVVGAGPVPHRVERVVDEQLPGHGNHEREGDHRRHGAGLGEAESHLPAQHLAPPPGGDHSAGDEQEDEVVEVGQERSLPLLGRDVLGRLDRRLRARVVHEHVQAAQLLHGLGHDPARLVLLLDVAAQGDRPAALGLDELLRALRVVVLGQVGDRHIGTFLRERDAHGASDA